MDFNPNAYDKNSPFFLNKKIDELSIQLKDTMDKNEKLIVLAKDYLKRISELEEKLKLVQDLNKKKRRETSVTLSLRLPKAVKEQLQTLSSKSNCTITSYIIRLITTKSIQETKP